MASKLITLGLACAAFQVAANPFPLLSERALSQTCRAVDDILAIISLLQAPATSFCSSFLNIGTSTSFSTVIPATRYTTVGAVATSTDVVTTMQAAKRWVKAPVAIPIGLKIFASNRLSTACSCLSIKPTITTEITTLATPVGILLICPKIAMLIQPVDFHGYEYLYYCYNNNHYIWVI
jgi:hypothetical protein